MQSLERFGKHAVGMRALVRSEDGSLRAFATMRRSACAGRYGIVVRVRVDLNTILVRMPRMQLIEEGVLGSC